MRCSERLPATGAPTAGHADRRGIGSASVGEDECDLSLEDLDEALRRGVNVSAVARQALREHLVELTDEENIVGCAAALADTETDAARSDTTIGDRIGPDKS